MKICPTCNQPLAENIAHCPTCGDEVEKGRASVDDYKILDFVHEGYDSILYRAAKNGTETSVLLRLFTPESGINDVIADRLRAEINEIAKLPADKFVRHYEIKQSSEGLWYRVSEWVETIRWGDLIASGYFNNYQKAFDLFAQIALALDTLHKTNHFIPHLILDDVLVVKSEHGQYSIKIDYKLSRFIDPKLARPRPALMDLLLHHPDFLEDNAA